MLFIVDISVYMSYVTFGSEVNGNQYLTVNYKKGGIVSINIAAGKLVGTAFLL